MDAMKREQGSKVLVQSAKYVLVVWDASMSDDKLTKDLAALHDL